MAATKKRGLGRGLNALLNTGPAPGAPAASAATAPAVSMNEAETVDGTLRALPVDLCERGKYQPRKDMHQESLQELADSIRAQGVVQPIVVRPVAGGRY
jgi:ParB family chromosome partitioning protein